MAWSWGVFARYLALEGEGGEVGEVAGEEEEVAVEVAEVTEMRWRGLASWLGVWHTETECLLGRRPGGGGAGARCTSWSTNTGQETG